MVSSGGGSVDTGKAAADRFPMVDADRVLISSLIMDDPTALFLLLLRRRDSVFNRRDENEGLTSDSGGVFDPVVSPDPPPLPPLEASGEEEIPAGTISSMLLNAVAADDDACRRLRCSGSANFVRAGRGSDLCTVHSSLLGLRAIVG